MKYILRLLVTILVVFLLSSCAKAPDPNMAVEQVLGQALVECHKTNGDVKVASINRMETPNDVLLFNAIEGLREAASKGFDPCANIITNNKLQMVAMQENTKRIAVGTDATKSIASSGVTALLGWKGLDVLGGALDSMGSDYTFTSSGDMSISDSFKTSKMGNIWGENQFGGILSNPSTAEPFFAPAPQLEPAITLGD